MPITLIIIITLSLLTAWNLALTTYLFHQKRFFSQLTQGVSKNDLKTILKNIASSLKTAGHELTALDNSINSVKKASQSHFQRLGFIRFNPFSDTGGDQSFSICVLDYYNSGFILTSFHSREQTRIYAKSIVNGKSVQSELSKEETEALKRALKSGPASG